MDAVPSMLEYIVRGAASAVLPMNLLVMFIGLVVGIVGGMLPGITTVTAVALFVPFTFSMPPDMALIGLGGVFCGAMYGGANAAILINTPGTPGSIATSLDGYPLVMQGRAEEACYIALIASVLGGIFGTVARFISKRRDKRCFCSVSLSASNTQGVSCRRMFFSSAFFSRLE